MTGNPLLTFLLVSYKQERFIREAVAGALAQTYSPLEIVISDDCSPDRTFEIIKELVAGYHGPHKIILHRNEKNLGLCGNVNQAVALSSGELIVGAAGDDISLPNRCARMAEEWLKAGRRWHSICCNAENIDETGRRLGLYVDLHEPRELNSTAKALETGLVGCSGCCHTFSRANYEIFGPLDPKAPGEDEILGFRSVVLGGLRWVPDVLILYRQHGNNLYKDAAALKRMDRSARLRALKEDEFACDLRYKLYRDYLQIAGKKDVISPMESAKLVALLDRRYPFYRYQFKCKYKFPVALFWLLAAAIRGEYRRGMFTTFKCRFLRFGIRAWLRKQMKKRGTNILPFALVSHLLGSLISQA